MIKTYFFYEGQQKMSKNIGNNKVAFFTLNSSH